MAVLTVVIILFTNFILIIHGSYHWVVTENGKIQAQVTNSGYPLRRSYDLVLLLEQEQRITTITKIYQDLVSFKQTIDEQWNKIEREEDFEEKLFSSDKDCILGTKPLAQHDLTTEFMDYAQGARPRIISHVPTTEPDCTTYSELDFSMMTFPHLETLNKRDNLTVIPTIERSPVQFDVESMLKKNHSDWTAYNVASFYWRILGNGTNAIECARRAIYFSPRDKRHIALLNLGTLLQELQSLGEAAIVLHSAVDHDPLQHISHLALGNVYAILGDYTRSLACYQNVLSLIPQHEKALQLKHAVYCQKKLETKLLEIHSMLQKILHDLQKYHEMTVNWQHLQNQVRWNKDNKIKDHNSFSQPMYFNLRMLLSNVEKQAKSLMNDMSRNVLQKKTFRQLRKNLKNKDCSDAECAFPDTSHILKGDNDDEDRDENDSKNEVSDSSDTMLKAKMHSLMGFIKALSDESNVKVGDFKHKIHQQINFLRNLYEDSHFSPEQLTFLTNFDGCVDINNDFKSLHDCFMRVLDTYSLSVGNRIEKLKETMQLGNPDDSQKNFVSDESSLENYIEVPPEIVFESESCKHFRDTNEL